ncbi:Isoeugenol synthase 1 [Bienertia sinuspersici]
MRKKVLIFGATGYLGKYMVEASIAMGHLTYAYTRPLKLGSAGDEDRKFKTLQDFKAMGVTIVEGELDDHEKLVGILRQVEIVISTLAAPLYLDQLKIISAMKESSNIERFIPSEFGNEVDRVTALPPFQALLNNKKRIRRAIEASGIPHTFVSGNSMAAYFIHYFFFHVVWNYEEDVANYTIRAATDPRTLNKILICRPLKNIASQLDVISSWEKKSGLTLNKVHIPEEVVIKQTQTLPGEISIPMAVLHNIFIKGEQMNYELKEDDIEASTLYSDYNYTSIDNLLDISLVNPPQVKIATFV